MKIRDISIFQISTEPVEKSADPDQIDRICHNHIVDDLMHLLLAD
jgi:hypothetical protein